jgi:PAS domain S-box-containing protein
MEKAYESVIENQFKAFENMLEGVSVYKLIFNEKGEAVDAKLEYMNHATVETMDLNQENAIGKNASELFSWNYLNLIFQAINEFLVTGKFKRFEVYYAPTDRYFIISGFNMPDDYFAVLRTDITKLKHTEEALKDTRDNLEEKVEERTAELKKAYESLKESEEKYKQFFEASPNFTVHVGLNGKIIDANRAALEILSKSKEELIGTNFTGIDMLFKEDVPIHVKNFLKLLVGKHVEHYETRIKTNGELRWGET